MPSPDALSNQCDGCLPSSLYTFPALSKKGLDLARHYLVLYDEGFTEFGR